MLYHGTDLTVLLQCMAHQSTHTHVHANIILVSNLGLKNEYSTSLNYNNFAKILYMSTSHKYNIARAHISTEWKYKNPEKQYYFESERERKPRGSVYSYKALLK